MQGKPCALSVRPLQPLLLPLRLTAVRAISGDLEVQTRHLRLLNAPGAPCTGLHVSTQRKVCTVQGSMRTSLLASAVRECRTIECSCISICQEADAVSTSPAQQLYFPDRQARTHLDRSTGWNRPAAAAAQQCRGLIRFTGHIPVCPERSQFGFSH